MSKLTRRELLGALGVTGASSLAGCNDIKNRFEDTEGGAGGAAFQTMTEKYEQVKRGETKSDLPNPAPMPSLAVTEEGLFEATDATDGEWVPVPHGTEENPVPEEHVEVHSAERASIKERETFGHTLDDFASGRAVGEQWASWPNRIHQTFASYSQRDRPILIFTSDGTHTEEYTDAHPRFKERGLPWLTAIDPGQIASNDGYMTEDELDEIMLHGCELGLYGGSPDYEGGNLVYDAEDLDDVKRIILKRKRQLEERGYPISCFMPRQKVGIDWGSSDEESRVDHALSHMLRSSFAAIGHSQVHNPEAEATKRVGNIVASTDTIEDGPSATEVKGWIDRLLKRPGEVFWIFFHSRRVTENGDWDRIEEILDYAKQKRDAGELDVMAPTTGVNIPFDREDADIVTESSPKFDNFADSFWGSEGDTPTVENWSGDPYWRCETTSSWISSLVTREVPLNPYFQNVMIQADARCPTGETNNSVYFQVTDFDDYPMAEDSVTVADDTWQTVFKPFGMPRADIGEPGSGGVRFLIGTKNAVELKNIRMYPC